MVDAALAELIIGRIALYKARALQDACDAQKLCGIEASAEVGPAQRRADILYARKRRASAHDHHVLCGARLAEAVFDLKPVRARTQLEAGLLASLGHGLGRKHVQHDGKLQYVK